MTDNRDYQRPKTNPSGLAVPHEVEDDVTGQHAGEELRAMRARRPTPERIQRLEDKHDALHEVVTETRVMVGQISTKLEALPRLEAAVERSVERNAQREQLHYKKTVEIGTAEQLADLDIKTNAIKTRRELAITALKIAAGIIPLLVTAFLAGRC
jgi:uncharacterized protein YhaN